MMTSTVTREEVSSCAFSNFFLLSPIMLLCVASGVLKKKRQKNKNHFEPQRYKFIKMISISTRSRDSRGKQLGWILFHG